MAYDNENEQRDSFRDKAKDFAKMFARRMIKKVAKELLKKLAKMALKLIAKALVKALLFLIGVIGVPALIIIICVILFVGAAIFIGKTFDWVDENSPVTAAELLTRYGQAAQSTSTDPRFRVPVWLLQDIDNISILKEDKQPWEINPERIAGALKSTITEETRATGTKSWIEGDNGPGSVSPSKGSQKLLTQERAWNRLITYTYTEVTDEEADRDSSSGGYSSESQSSTHTSKRWVPDVEEYQDFGSAGTLTIFSYKSLTDISSSYTDTPLKDPKSTVEETGTETSGTFSSTWSEDGQDITKADNYYGTKTIKTYRYTNSQESAESSYDVQMSSGGSDFSWSVEQHHSSTRWVVSEIKEEPNFELFDNLLQDLAYTRTDFNYLENAIAEDDPSLAAIAGYSTEHLIADDLDVLTGGTDGNGGTYIGGRLPDSPDIPTSSDWVFPTNPNAIIGDGFSVRFDPVKKKTAMHKGQDISRSPADRDEGMDYTNYAVSDGKVVSAGDANDGYGYKVVIDHGGGISTLYGHMIAGSLQVKAGDNVRKGQALGIMGATGMVTGIHLHFEVHINGEPVNPLGYLRR